MKGALKCGVLVTLVHTVLGEGIGSVSVILDSLAHFILDSGGKQQRF